MVETKTFLENIDYVDRREFMKIIPIPIFLALILAACSAPVQTPTYYEFSYDRIYPSSFPDVYPESCRVLSAYKFAEPEGLTAENKQTIQALLYDGLDYEDYINKRLEYFGSNYTGTGSCIGAACFKNT